jgi:putative transposase
MVFFGERRFREAVASHVEHYHTERAHQGLGNVRIERETNASLVREVCCKDRHGGLLRYYERAV